MLDNSPQLIRSLLRQLIHEVGVAPEDITVGDPTGMVPNFYWDMLRGEFPAVSYLDNFGGSGRTRAEFSPVTVTWSTAAAAGKRQDYVPAAYADAAYLLDYLFAGGAPPPAPLAACGSDGTRDELECEWFSPCTTP